MRLIDGDLRQKDVPMKCYRLELEDGLSDELKKKLTKEISTMLKEKGIGDIIILDVKMDLGVWAKSREGEQRRNPI